MSDPVFVFGSNLAGRHGAGAAWWADPLAWRPRLAEGTGRRTDLERKKA